MKNVHLQSNNNFLQSIVLQVESLSCSLIRQMICIKDINSITVFCSKALAEFLHIDNNDIVGKITWLPLYSNNFNIETIIIKEDQSVVTSQEIKSFLKINNINGILKPYLCSKSPIINPATKDVVGIYVNCIENGIYNILNNITQSNNNLSSKAKLPYLNRREKQVIFLFLAHLSSIEIADVLYKLEGKRISKSTVDSIFNDQLYIKFSVNSRPALYDKLLKFGYDKMIPHEILSSNSLTISQLNSY